MVCPQDILSYPEGEALGLGQVPSDIQDALRHEDGLDRLTVPQRRLLQALQCKDQDLAKDVKDRFPGNTRFLETYEMLQLTTANQMLDARPRAGSRIEVWWEEEQRFFRGTITERKVDEFAYVIYDDDDHDKGWLPMTTAKYKLVDGKKRRHTSGSDQEGLARTVKCKQLETYSSSSSSSTLPSPKHLEDGAAEKENGSSNAQAITSKVRRATNIQAVRREYMEQHGYPESKSSPRKLSDGTFCAPTGRRRVGYVWEEKLGLWKPVQKGGKENDSVMKDSTTPSKRPRDAKSHESSSSTKKARPSDEGDCLASAVDEPMENQHHVDTMLAFGDEIKSWLSETHLSTFGKFALDRSDQNEPVYILSPFELADEKTAAQWIGFYETLKQERKLDQMPYAVAKYKTNNNKDATFCSGDVSVSFVQACELIPWKEGNVKGQQTHSLKILLKTKVQDCLTKLCSLPVSVKRSRLLELDAPFHDTILVSNDGLNIAANIDNSKRSETKFSHTQTATDDELSTASTRYANGSPAKHEKAAGNSQKLDYPLVDCLATADSMTSSKLCSVVDLAAAAVLASSHGSLSDHGAVGARVIKAASPELASTTAPFADSPQPPAEPDDLVSANSKRDIDPYPPNHYENSTNMRLPSDPVLQVPTWTEADPNGKQKCVKLENQDNDIFSLVKALKSELKDLVAVRPLLNRERITTILDELDGLNLTFELLDISRISKVMRKLKDDASLWQRARVISKKWKIIFQKGVDDCLTLSMEKWKLAAQGGNVSEVQQCVERFGSLVKCHGLAKSFIDQHDLCNLMDLTGKILYQDKADRTEYLSLDKWIYNVLTAP